MNTTEDNTGSESTPPRFPPSLSGRLRRLRINQFRNVQPGTELRFDDDMNVLLGRNGTGKTTLLELISAISQSALEAYEHEEFDLECDLGFGDLCLSLHIQNIASKEETSGLGLDRSGHNLSWEYRLSFSFDGEPALELESKPGASTVRWMANDDSQDLSEVSPFVRGFTLFAIDKCLHSVTAPRKPDLMAALALAMYGHADLARSCVRLDEGLDVFRSIVAPPSLSGVTTLLNLYSDVDDSALIRRALDQHYTPQALRGYATSNALAEDRHNEITFHGDRISFLGTMASVLGAEDVQLTLHLMERTIEHGVTRSTFGRPLFRITKRDTTFTHDRLSYGEKRLLAFLYHAAVNTDILVADELVNGLHYEWIGACLDAIKGQAFLSSQNPLLLDHLPFSSAEEAERRFVLCTTDEDGTWTWRNMTPDEAGTFFRAYEVGVQHVSSILRTKGLW